MGHTWKWFKLGKNGSPLEKWVTLGKMGHSLKNRSPVKMVLFDKNGSHWDNWVTLAKKRTWKDREKYTLGNVETLVTLGKMGHM